MELQFQKMSIPGLRCLSRQVQNQEQTQEVKLTDGMPDVGRVLSAWGQVMLRGKEWRGDTVSVSCGCTVWVLYAPEDGSPPQSLEAWIPFNLKWEVPETDRDGVFSADCLVRSVDARMLSGRKLMLRASVGVLVQTYIPEQTEVSVAEALPEDVQLQTQTYNLCMAREAGEKPYMIDEEVQLPQSCEPLEKLIRYTLSSQVLDRRIMTDKVVFRGTAALHILYRGQDGELHTWDFEIPFSQYAELTGTYSHDATARISPALTSLELDVQDGRLRLKAGLTGQYVILDTQCIQVAADAYSLRRPVTIRKDLLVLPAVVGEETRPVTAEATVNQPAARIVDAVFYPDHPVTRQPGDTVTAEMTGLFQLLYYDEEGSLQSSSTRWEETVPVTAAENIEAAVFCTTEKPEAQAIADSVAVRNPVELQAVLTQSQQIPMVTGLELGEMTEPDPNRPSLILRKARQDDLWQIAKQCGSTVEAIMEANGLQDAPSPEEMLLIPVK